MNLPNQEPKPLLRFWNGWLKEQTPLIIISIILMAIVALASSSYPILLGAIIDALANLLNNPGKDVFHGFTAKTVAFYGPIAIILVTFIKGVTWYISTITSNQASIYSTAKLQKDFFEKILSLDYGRITKEQPGSFSSRILNDTGSISNAIIAVANGYAREVLTLIGVIIAMFSMDWQLSIIAMIIIPLAVFPVNKIGQNLKKITIQGSIQSSKILGLIEESIGGIRLVKTYGLEKSENEKFGKALDTAVVINLKGVEQKGRMDPMLELLGGAAVSAVLAFAAYRISEGQSTVGNLMGFITSLMIAAQSSRTLGNMTSSLQQAKASLIRVYEILNEEPHIKDADNAKELIQPNGNIDFDDVSFSISGNNILKHINFSANKGQTIALVGLSGAGKSSIINLIPRLFEVSSGKVTIDGNDIRNLTLTSLRSAIALVSQDAVMFENTVANNIRLGTIGKSDDDVIKALKQASCDFIFNLPDGINSMVAPRGSNFSGGERQRLSLARAILRNSPILLLDEPTSALDSENEAKIAKVLDNFSKDKTTIVVAHRLSTVRNANVILVMKDGEIIERGRHDELIEQGGQYADLAKLQLN